MRRLGYMIIGRRWWVLGAGLLLMVGAGAFGAGAASRLSSGGFNEPGAESSRADRALTDQFRTGPANVLLLVTAKRGTVTDPALVASGRRLTAELAGQPGIVEAYSFWSLGQVPQLRSGDGRRALVLGFIPGNEDAVRKKMTGLSERFTRSNATMSVGVGGTAEVFRAVSQQAEKDLSRAELISTPVTVLLLVLVFGSLVAAALPLPVAGVAVVGTLAVLRLFAMVTDVSVFSLNLTTALGLGLAIDYSLFIVSRYREEVRLGRQHEAALLRTMQTAGRTVAFSALTVGVSLAALLVFPMAYLRSFAYAGTGVVALAGVGAVIFLPALLAVVGPWVEVGTLWQRRSAPAGGGFWRRLALAVMRRPIPIGGAVIAVLVILGVPFLGIKLGLADDRVLPPNAPVRQVDDALRASFGGSEAGALPVVAAARGNVRHDPAEIDSYAKRLSGLASVARVDAVTGFYAKGARLSPPIALNKRFGSVHGTWLSVVPSVEPFSPAAERLVHAIRGSDAPFPVTVGGPSAQLVDSRATLTARLPIALGLIAVATFVLLFLMVGSLLVPLKALLLNVLSLSATFGAMVWVFQEGHLAGVLHFTPTGAIDIFTPVLMFCVAFGLSMDYEVFLISRIKEEYDLHQQNERAVAVGLEHTGRIVTAAALLLSLVFLAFATSEVSIIKLIGLGLALAVLVDAFLIRATLVPAFMRLAGRANWWAPRRLRRLHLRYGVWESEPLAILDRAEQERSAARR